MSPTDLGYADFYQTIEPYYPCECCRPLKGTTFTSTATTHKWTKDEILAEIVYISKELAWATWGKRGELRMRLRHWVKKLERFEEAENEFIMS
jgi:hypothetical protein